MHGLGATQSVALTGSDQAVRTSSGWYRGFVAVETGGSSTAPVRVYDNAAAASGTLSGAPDPAA